MASGKDKELIYKEINDYITLLKECDIHILQAYLFGSYSQGGADEWSDIDLALVTSNLFDDTFDFRFKLTKLARDIDSDIEPHPYHLNEFNMSNPFVEEIIRTGERLL